MRVWRISLGCALLALAGCESTPDHAATIPGGTGQHADPAMLATGRALFEGRCARCHTLPKVATHSAGQWPGLVGQMEKRAGLKPAQSQSVLSYILHLQKQG